MSMFEILRPPTAEHIMQVRFETAFCQLLKISDKTTDELENIINKKSLEFKILTLHGKHRIIKSLIKKALAGDEIK